MPDPTGEGYDTDRPSGPGPYGPPNSSGVVDYGNGKGTITDYDDQGKAKTDYDFGHNHGQGDPHAHDWDHSGPKPVRGKGMELRSCA